MRRESKAWFCFSYSSVAFLDIVCFFPYYILELLRKCSRKEIFAKKQEVFLENEVRMRKMCKMHKNKGEKTMKFLHIEKELCVAILRKMLYNNWA